MYYCSEQGTNFYALTPELLPAAPQAIPPGEIEEAIYLFSTESAEYGRDAFAVTHPGQLYLPEGVGLLDTHQLDAAAQEVPAQLEKLIAEAKLRAVKCNHPRFAELLKPRQQTKKHRVNLIAIGDVGSTLLLGLRLMGGDILSQVGIYDLSADALRRFEFEVNQINTIGLENPLPEISILTEEDLFDCDMLIFCATKGVPPLTAQGDVRMAQFVGNRGLVAHYAKLARKNHFAGIFAVVSDPVDLLCKVAWQESNQDEAGNWDGKGLFSEQIEGYGLGVMYARAAYFAKKDPRFASFLQDGAAYGPHGEALVIANSLTNYDDALSSELTRLTTTANLTARAYGFKPYLAPALSSAAFNILNTLRGRPHHSTTLLGDIFFGAISCRSKYGIQLEAQPLPAQLFQRISAAATELREAF